MKLAREMKSPMVLARGMKTAFPFARASSTQKIRTLVEGLADLMLNHKGARIVRPKVTAYRIVTSNTLSLALFGERVSGIIYGVAASRLGVVMYLAAIAGVLLTLLSLAGFVKSGVFLWGLLSKLPAPCARALSATVLA